MMTRSLTDQVRQWSVRLLWSGILVIAVVAVLTLDAAAQADEDSGSEPQIPAVTSNPLAPAETSSPQATLTSLIENVSAAYQHLEGLIEVYEQQQPLLGAVTSEEVELAEEALERAIQTLDLSQVPPISRRDVGTETVLELVEVLDRIGLPDTNEVPNASEIEALGLGPQDLLRWRIPNTHLEIVRVTEGQLAGEFLFSPQTVACIDGDYQTVRDLPYRPGAAEGFYEFYNSTPGYLMPPRWSSLLYYVPDWSNIVYGRQTVWQWVTLGLALLLAIAIVFVVYRLSHRFEPKRLLSRMLVRLLTPSVAIVVTIFVGTFVDDQVNITGQLTVLVDGVQIVVISLMAVWIIWVLAIGIADWIISSPRIDPEGLNASLIRMLAKILVVALGVLIIASAAAQLGIPTVAVIASLGIGGLAIGLAASPTIENLLGSVNLFADKPVRVGDFCRYGDAMGTVEEIGLRSTKLRGTDRTITSIPNGDFCKMQIVNFAPRDRLLLRTTIGLRYGTTPEQLRFVLAKLRELLLAHPRITDDPAWVRFTGFGDYALNLEVSAYANTAVHSEFLAIQEDLFLRVIDIVSEAGTDFAIPAQKTYLTHSEGHAVDQGQAAEAQVQAWREAGILPFPDFSDVYREQINNTLDYPPDGSPQSAFHSEADDASTLPLDS